MKRSIFVSLLAFIVTIVNAQNTDIALTVTIPENSGIPKDAQNLFETRIRNMANSFGLISDDAAVSQFEISAKTVIQDQNVVGSAPTIYTYDLDINLYLNDRFNGTQFENTNFRAKGAGQSEAKAFINALNRMNVSTPAIKNFLEKGKQRIINYYETQGDVIISQVMAYAYTHNYEKAIAMLFAIPTFCTETYAKAQVALLDVYQQYIDYEGAQLLSKATAIWASTQNRDGGLLAGSLLVQIDPKSQSRKDADALVKTIQERIGQEWKLEMKKYDDSVAIEKQQIEAARQIGVAYGNGQKSTTTNIVR